MIESMTVAINDIRIGKTICFCFIHSTNQSTVCKFKICMFTSSNHLHRKKIERNSPYAELKIVKPLTPFFHLLNGDWAIVIFPFRLFHVQSNAIHYTESKFSNMTPFARNQRSSCNYFSKHCHPSELMIEKFWLWLIKLGEIRLGHAGFPIFEDHHNDGTSKIICPSRSLTTTTNDNNT